MSNGPEALIAQLHQQLLKAIDDGNISEIKNIDNKISGLLSHPKMDREKHKTSLKRLKEVHDKALAFVKEESQRVSSEMVSLRENSEGLRGYFEVSGE